MMNRYVLLSLACGLLAFARQTQPIQVPDSPYYSQGSGSRMAAEWEPAVGVMVAWPLALPHKLVVELAHDSRLITLVDNVSAGREARRWYARWGIDTTRVRFVVAPQGVDAWWVRDWGPYGVFGPDGSMKLGDPRYIYSTPETGPACADSLRFLFKDSRGRPVRTETDDAATRIIGSALGIPVLDLPFISTGGNVANDGQHAAFSTCVLLNENRYDGTPDDGFFSRNSTLLGLSRYHMLSNYEPLGIQHIDCFMKLLDEERILVARPPTSHPLRAVYDRIVDEELRPLKTAYGRPYELLRLDTAPFNEDPNGLAAYTNSLILNKTIYVPLFGIAQDSVALRQWSEAMPGYRVKGFTYRLADEPYVDEGTRKNYGAMGWRGGDALHCRTRALWDSAMLYMTLKRLPATVKVREPLTVYATLIDYSRKGLVANSPKLRWRVRGEGAWREVPLTQADAPTHFTATLPAGKAVGTVEYYVTATSRSGRTETLPRTAPAGFYTVRR
jgi:agmatine/peptidylarginine deiminase